MREIAILTFLTLDGVMQGPMSPEEDSSNDFTQGGWAAPYYDKVMKQVEAVAMAEPYDMLFGKKTYDMFAPHFSNLSEESPMAKRMNSASKFVVTSSMEKLPWQNSHRIKGDIVAQVSQLKSQDGPLLQIHGSGELIQTLLKHDLVDEFRLWTFPVLLGNGKRLFNQCTTPSKLKLVKADSLSDGVVMGIYRR